MDPVALAVVARLIHKLKHDVSNSLVAAMGELELLADDAHDADLAQRLRDTRATLVRPYAELRRVSQTLPLPGGAVIRLQDLMQQLADRAQQLGVTLQWSSGAREQLTVTDWLRPVVVALVANALDAAEAGGTVEVNVKVAAGQLQVRDDGRSAVDLAAAAAGRLMRAGGGHLGLGLPVAAALVGAHGGHLVLSAAPDSGVIASATWPVA